MMYTQEMIHGMHLRITLKQKLCNPPASFTFETFSGSE